MEKIEFQGELREKTGKGVARETRRTGFIPAILYGQGTAPVLIKVIKRSTEKTVMHLESYNVMGDLVLGKNGKTETIKIIVKEIQFKPTTGEILHLDFYRVRMDKPVIMEIPVHLIGESPGIEQGGILEHELREIKLESLPKDIPNKIEVDITNLNIGDVLFVKNLSLPEKVRLVEEEEKVVVSILAPRKIEEEEEEEKVEEEVEAEPEVISAEKAEERRKEKEEKGEKDEEKGKKEPQEKSTK